MQNGEENELNLISEETLFEMVGDAMRIPSIAKGKPTQFVVLNDIEALSKAAEIVLLSPHTMHALAAIIVCGDLNSAEEKDKWMLDCEAASQQLLQAAYIHGLGAYRSSIYPDRDRIHGITTMLGLPDHIIAHSYVSLGYPVKLSEKDESFSSDRVHYNSWVRK
jgi:nitroreductase